MPAVPKKRIMLVEDDADTATALSMLFRLEGFDAQVAKNGRQGYQSSLENPPDLVVTDLSMPVMTGFDLIIAFKENAALRDIPIIAVSAMDTSKLQSAVKLGAQAVYQKPLDFERFLDAIIRMLAPSGGKQSPGGRNSARTPGHSSVPRSGGGYTEFSPAETVSHLQRG
ncbi:MAG TPA: response regulator [Blastocatellia bacterium]